MAGIRQKLFQACCCHVRPCWHDAVQTLGHSRAPADGSDRHSPGGNQQKSDAVNTLPLAHGELLAV